MLDMLDVTGNRISSLSLISDALQGMKELRELNVSGNPCTPRDVNGNIYGDECMSWWYAIVARTPQVEVLDDMVCTSEDVVRTAKLKKREMEVEERRAGGKGTKGGEAKKVVGARPKSARRKKVAVAAEEKAESPSKKGNVPLVKPPQAYSGREGVFGKLEPMDDIESKFADIRAKLNMCKELTRPEGEKVQLGGGEGGKEDISPQTAQKREKGRIGGEATSKVRRQQGVDETSKGGRSPSKPVTTKGEKKNPKSALARALNYDLSQKKREKVREAKEGGEEEKEGGEEAKKRGAAAGGGGRRKPKASSMIQSMLKKADQRIKQAQAYSGSTKSYLMPSDKGTAAMGEGVGGAKEQQLKEDTTNANDAIEFHPEFEQYEGATLDDYDMGFGFGSSGGGGRVNADANMKQFNLDDFDDSSSEDEWGGGKVGIAPRSRTPTPEVVAGGTEGMGEEEDEEEEKRQGGEGDGNLADINPFTGKPIVHSKEDIEAARGEDDERGGGGAPQIVPKLGIKEGYTPENVPLVSPRYENPKAAFRRGAPTLQERKGGLKPRLRRGNGATK